MKIEKTRQKVKSNSRQGNVRQVQKTTPRTNSKQQSIYLDLSTPSPDLPKQTPDKANKKRTQQITQSNRIKQNKIDIEIAPLDVSITKQVQKDVILQNQIIEEDKVMVEDEDEIEQDQQLLGRLTINSINNVPSSRLNRNSQGIQKGSNHINFQVFTPFDSSVQKNEKNYLNLFNEESQEKNLNPNNLKRTHTNFNSQNMKANRTALFVQGSANLTNRADTDYKSSSFQQHNKNNRDSLILSQKKEHLLNPIIISLKDDQSHKNNHNQWQTFQRSSFLEEELDEIPLFSQRASQVQFRDHRFSIRTIHFNLISSLMGTGGRSSMLSRASSKLQDKKKQITPKKQLSQYCPPKCPRGIQMIFSCCSQNQMQLSSNRGKSENTSNYSNTSTFGKVLIHSSSINNNFNNNGGNQGNLGIDNNLNIQSNSFVLFNSNQNNGSNINNQVLTAQFQSSNANAEDFTDEVDEYQNDQQNHRMSIVKRYNINTNLYQPGSRIAQFSPIIYPLNINSYMLNDNSIPANNQSKEESKIANNKQSQQQTKLNQFVTKIPQSGSYPSNKTNGGTVSSRKKHDQEGDDDEEEKVEEKKEQSSDINIKDIQVNLSSNQSMTNKISDESQTSSSGMQSQDIHRLHFLQTIQALHFIKNGLTQPSDKEISHLKLDLPQPNDPKKKKTIIFDMDETLIHCVDDIESEDPQFIIPIQFPDEDEPVNAGINVRPYIYECLEEANKHFQVIVFTASHKAYADAILDYIDPDNKYIQYRLYRENCIQTKEGYYVKDLRIFRNRDLKDLVIVDNSVYSFSFQIDNGIPIIPFYEDKEDEEMLHLIYYLNCIHQVEDVREQNREAFELSKLQYQSTQEILAQYYTNNKQQMLLQNEEDDEQIMMEENEDTQELITDHDQEGSGSGGGNEVLLKEMDKNGSAGSLYLQNLDSSSRNRKKQDEEQQPQKTVISQKDD